MSNVIKMYNLEKEVKQVANLLVELSGIENPENPLKDLDSTKMALILTSTAEMLGDFAKNIGDDEFTHALIKSLNKVLKRVANPNIEGDYSNVKL